jgi:phosphoribosylanthranilate isomerase
MVKVKICGITNLTDANASIKAGCDALGFVFYRKSPRYIDPERARTIIAGLKKPVIIIGVFVNARKATVKRIAKRLGLDILQFHGNESPEFCQSFKKYKVIKALRVKDTIDKRKISRFRPFAFLFDAFSPSLMGGTGKKFDWSLCRHLEGINAPVFLSGGLTERNVMQAVKTAHPQWVDVCSGVESRPGFKDPLKVKRFIKAAKSAIRNRS